jgi:hypothetical protein
VLESGGMSDALLLDILFGIIALLFIPIGFRRGVQREVFVAAGVLTGAQLSASWARPWGSDLALQIDVRTGIGQFTISAIFLIGATILLGYGGSAAIRPPEPTIWGRLAGAILAVTSGALLTGFLLRDIERFLTDPGTERTLEKSRIAWTLLRQFGWVLLGASCLMLLLIAVSVALRNRQAKHDLLSPVSTVPWEPPPPVPSARKPRLAWGADEGKVEPSARAFDPGNGRYGADVPSAHDTIPIAPVDAAAWSPDRARGLDRQTDDWMEIPTRQDSGWPARTGGSLPDRGALRCRGCGEALSPDDMFCPGCGRASGA